MTYTTLTSFSNSLPNTNGVAHIRVKAGTNRPAGAIASATFTQTVNAPLPAVTNAQVVPQSDGSFLLTWNDYATNPVAAATTYKLSTLGVPNDATLTLGSTNTGTDGYAAIQNILNQAGSNSPIVIDWDVKVGISNILTVKSNTTINVAADCGAILKSGAHKPLFRNANPVFSVNANIIDHDIIINGGIWNGNNAGQTAKGTPANGLTNVFSWFGVRNLTVKNFTIYTPKVYAIQGINILNGLYEDFVVDVGAGAINMDGVHFDGWCKDCIVRRGNLKTYDDGVGINSDDIYLSPLYANGVVSGYYPASAAGPSSNILIEDIVFNNSLFGIRLLSGSSRIDNITIRNISGTTKGYALLIDNYWQHPDDVTVAGRGNIGSVTVDNFNVVVTTANMGAGALHEAIISLTDNIESLVVTNFTPTTNSIPSVFIDQSYTYGVVTVNGVNQVIAS